MNTSLKAKNSLHTTWISSLKCIYHLFWKNHMLNYTLSVDFYRKINNLQCLWSWKHVLNVDMKDFWCIMYSDLYIEKYKKTYLSRIIHVLCWTFLSFKYLFLASSKQIWGLFVFVQPKSLKPRLKTVFEYTITIGICLGF